MSKEVLYKSSVNASISTLQRVDGTWARTPKTKAEELAPLATNRSNFGTQKELLYGENSAINSEHGPAYMLRNSERFHD